MINLFDNFDRASMDFVRSQLIAKIKIPSVAINDDGFLPDEVDSPVKLFCNLNDNHLPLHFDEIKVPHFWRITSSGNMGQVLDLTKKRADIIYSSADNRRLVKEVRWLDEDGAVTWIDHYDQHGHRFAKTILVNNQPSQKEYYDKRGRKVITHDLRLGDVFLNYEGRQHHFPDLAHFVAFFLHERHYNLDHVFYNTLNQALAVTMQLSADGTDTLIWHEKTGKQIPGNMQFLLKNKTRTKHIVFQRSDDWQRRDDFLPDEKGDVEFSFLGNIYPHPRGNDLKPNALIMTNSDQIPQLDVLVQLMPHVQFNIAAITQMSPKLLAFQDRPNVNLYPNVSETRVKKLLANCDVYLDINKGNEILQAVRVAFEQNMLIVGFKDTLHEPQFVMPGNIFDQNDVRMMAQTVMSAFAAPKMMGQLVDGQREFAGDVSVDEFQEAFKKLH